MKPESMNMTFSSESTNTKMSIRKLQSEEELVALMDRAHQWLDTTDAHWSENAKTWLFPSGATLRFGYLASENDKYNYQGAEFNFLGFDEGTQFSGSTISLSVFLFTEIERFQGSTESQDCIQSWWQRTTIGFGKGS